MRRKLAWFVLSAGIMVTALFHARPAMATPPNDFTSTPLAQGQFGELALGDRCTCEPVRRCRHGRSCLKEGRDHDPGTQHEPH